MKRSGSRNGGVQVQQVQPVQCNDRFYSRDEYRKSTPGNQVYLKYLRDKRTGLNTSKAFKKAKSSGDQEHNLQRNVATLISVVDDLQVAAKEPEATEGTDSTNSALKIIETRQKKD